MTARSGRPLLFRGVHRNLRRAPAVTAADVIVAGAVHDIHSARWLMGDDVALAYASHITDMPERPETTQLVLLQLTFRGGGLATIEVDVDSNYGYEVVVEVSGERGMLGTPSLMSPILRKDGTASRAVEADWLERFETGLPARGRGVGARRARRNGDRRDGVGRLCCYARRRRGDAVARLRQGRGAAR